MLDPDEQLVRRYYTMVDEQNFAELLDLFSDDAVYERQGTPTIVGKTALRQFYLSQRMILDGKHRLDEVLPGRRWTAVRGNFQGRLKNGEDIDLEFTDWHHISIGKICHRQSLFPGRTV